MHQPSSLIGSEKCPKLKPLTENYEYEVGVSKYKYNGKITPLNDKPIQLTVSCQMTSEQERLVGESLA